MMDLEPCYDFKNHNGYVSLVQNLPCSFILREEEFNCQAEIVLDSNCSVYVKTEIQLDIKQSFVFISSMSDITNIILNGQKIPAFISKISSSSGDSTITFSPSEEPFPLLGGDETRLSKVIFHLFNFKDRIGTSRKEIESGDSIGVTKLASSKWKVELHETSNAEKTEFQKNSIHTLTHVCCLSREDSTEFDGKSAQKILNELRIFFTFSQGVFCSPVMPVGYDINENRVWAVGSSPDKTEKSAMSWFDPHHSDQLAQLFPHFISKLEDARWGDTFHKIIYWYARSNNTSGRGIDTGIILTQIAVERLAYEYAVNHKKMIESKGFKDLKASDKLRLLFASLDIPIAIPPNMLKIQKVASKFGYIDSPYFLTEIRNSIVHPEHKRKNDFSDLYYDAWRLGMWYLELAILRLCNYEGTYASRLSNEHYVGEVEDLPWHKNRAEKVV